LLETDYHQRKHSSLEGDTPTKRFQQRSENIRVLESGIDLEAHFLKRIERRVRLDATISINGQIWEVPTHLRRHKVQVRYNPFNFSRVEIWMDDKFIASAQKCDKNINAVTFINPKDLYARQQ
jgi:putative transposase